MTKVQALFRGYILRKKLAQEQKKRQGLVKYNKTQYLHYRLIRRHFPKSFISLRRKLSRQSVLLSDTIQRVRSPLSQPIFTRQGHPTLGSGMGDSGLAWGRCNGLMERFIRENGKKGRLLVMGGSPILMGTAILGCG